MEESIHMEYLDPCTLFFFGGMAQMKEFIVEGKNQQPTRVAIHPILGSQMFTASNMDIRNAETI
jgi:hypothetical protein